MNINDLRETLVLATLLVWQENHSVASCPKDATAVNSAIGLIGTVISNE
jgi:hypothetical protein